MPDLSISALLSKLVTWRWSRRLSAGLAYIGIAAVGVNLIDFAEMFVIFTSIISIVSPEEGIKEVISAFKPIFLFSRVIFCQSSPASNLNMSFLLVWISLDTPVADQIFSALL